MASRAPDGLDADIASVKAPMAAARAPLSQSRHRLRPADNGLGGIDYLHCPVGGIATQTEGDKCVSGRDKQVICSSLSVLLTRCVLPRVKT